ncbi:hypothetical protein [Dyella japonica]|uniref:Uncharacterized protein n=1 Tax=Dyella japonica DSM 16301 TaxID=1440762 RepID=A0A0G9HDT9_9GAMM|nr:hypothetical protein [Dyella japonica]KLD65857.1 hypothetical protein Y882_01405 [Dyella japonica DSM 16301]
MRKFIVAIVLTTLVAHAYAQSQPQGGQDRNGNTTARVPCLTDESGAHCAGAATASEAATGNLTPLYVGAGVIGAAVIAGALNGGGDGHHDPASGSGGGGTSGTTGTH